MNLPAQSSFLEQTIGKSLLAVSIDEKVQFLVSKRTYGNLTIGTTLLPELTLPIEMAVSGALIRDFATLTGVIFVAKIGLGSVDVNHIVSSGVYRLNRSQLMPGTLLNVGTFEETTARKIHDLRSRVRTFRGFGKGWDEEEAEPFAAETLENADRVTELILSASIASSIVPNALVGPLPDAGIRFEWAHGNKELFVTIHRSNIEVQRWYPLEAVEAEGCWHVSLEGILPHIEWLLA